MFHRIIKKLMPSVKLNSWGQIIFMKNETDFFCFVSFLTEFSPVLPEVRFYISNKFMRGKSFYLEVGEVWLKKA